MVFIVVNRLETWLIVVNNDYQWWYIGLIVMVFIVVEDALKQQQWEKIMIIYWLVVSNTWIIFHNAWDVILSIDELIFFQMVVLPPTRVLLTIMNYIITIIINHYWQYINHI